VQFYTSIASSDSEPCQSVYEGVSKRFRTESITKYTLTTINIRWEATQRVMAAKLTRLAHKIAIQLLLVAESCTICSSRSRRPVRKLLDTPLYNSVILPKAACRMRVFLRVRYKSKLILYCLFRCLQVAIVIWRLIVLHRWLNWRLIAQWMYEYTVNVRFSRVWN
jgi:hypothetical protein